MLNENFKAKIWPQLLAAFAANMGAFAWGTMVAWSAAALPKIRLDPEFTDISSNEGSWIGSIATLGACIAGLPAGWAVDFFGRKKTMLFICMPFLAGWLLVAFAQNVSMIIAGRFIIGFCGGIYTVAAPIFIAETAEPRIRGMLINGFDLLICIGMLSIIIIGKYISWNYQAMFCACIPVICFLLMAWIPESPRFLLSQGLQTEGSHSLQWFRGASDVSLIKQELFQLIESVEANKAVSAKEAWKELRTPHARKAFFLGFLLFLFQIGTGMIAANAYTVDIFISAGSTMDEYDSSIVLSSVSTVASIASASVVDRFGRRILLAISQLSVVVSLVGLGAFFHLKEVKAEFTESNLGWLPLTCLLIFMSGYSFGIGPIPFSLAPEVLPQRSRGLASSILSTWRCGLAFLVTRFFANLIDSLGDDGCYWFFAALSLLGLIFIVAAIPETKGKSLEEIQMYFTKRSAS